MFPALRARSVGRNRYAWYLFLILGFGCSAASKEPEPYWETPNQKLYALGGKETPAKVIARGQELTTEDIAQGRDLSLYDPGGLFDCQHHWDEPSRDHCDMQAIRRFIWTHWTQRREVTSALRSTASMRGVRLTYLLSRVPAATGMSRGVSLDTQMRSQTVPTSPP